MVSMCTHTQIMVPQYVPGPERIVERVVEVEKRRGEPVVRTGGGYLTRFFLPCFLFACGGDRGLPYVVPHLLNTGLCVCV